MDNVEKPVEFKFTDVFVLKDNIASTKIPIKIAHVGIAPGIDVDIDKKFSNVTLRDLIPSTLFGNIENGVYVIESYGISLKKNG